VQLSATKRGRQPKPTELRVIEGNNGRGLGRRAVNKREPKPRLGVPPAPGHLTARARAVWRLVVDEMTLAAPKLLTRLDGGVLGLYCQATARHEQAEAAIELDIAAGKPLDRFKVLVSIKYAQQMHMAAD